MKWVVLTGFLVLLGRSDGSVLRCSPDGTDAPCLSEKEKGPSQQDVEETPALECLPGSEWESNCHYCRCSDGGTALCHKAASCEDTVFVNQKAEQPLPVGKECAAGSSWKNSCQTCVCSELGYSSCNATACIGHNEAAYSCAPLSTWADECNTCWCSPHGIATCTKIGCERFGIDPENDSIKKVDDVIAEALPLLKAASNQTCKAKAMFIKDCNICWCNELGTDYFCTRKVCVNELPDEPPVDTPEVSLIRKARSSPQELPKACQPGQEFRLDCNKCLCDNEGLSFSCTRIDCAAQNSAQSAANTRTKRDVTSAMVDVETNCTPDSVFQAECNACRCSADGRSARCTSAECTPNTLDSAHAPEPDPGFRCNPGEQFKKDCNDCTCSADGRSTFCTLRFCDETLPHSLMP